MQPFGGDANSNQTKLRERQVAIALVVVILKEQGKLPAEETRANIFEDFSKGTLIVEEVFIKVFHQNVVMKA
jgi:hypothetical protein